MDRRRRIVPYALFGAGLGVVAAVLVFLAWALGLAQSADPWEDADGGAPEPAALASTPPPAADGPPGAADGDDPALARATIADLGTIPGPDRLTVTVTDPLGLLDQRSELRASGKGSLVCRKWRRRDDELTATWPDPEQPPAVVEFSLQALRPEFAVAASAPLTPDPAGGWRATLDLSECAAFVEFTVTGAPEVLAACSLKVGFQQPSAQPGTLDQSWDLQAPVLVIAPVPCTITTALNDRSSRPQYAQRALFPITQAGRHRFEIPAATGSVRVRIHEPPGPSSRALTTLLVELQPAIERGGFFTQRLTETGHDDVAFTLVPPGRYELNLYEQQSSTRKLIGGRTLEVGAGETLVEFRSPADQRIITVHHAAPAGTEVWLLRAGVAGDVSRGAQVRDGATPVQFDGLDAAEWVIWARGADGVAVARADTRFSHHAETTLGAFAPLSCVEFQLPAKLPTNYQIRLPDAAGRVLHVGPQRHEGGHRYTTFVPPGALEVRALHGSGLLAETTVLVPPGATDAAPLLVPLNFRFP